ncbi:MAG: YqaE/Pmp3 family membrane protein [Parerythrobacter sp.]
MNIVTLIITVLLPPVGVAMKHGLGMTFLINLVLTLIFFFPGMIHALYVNYG